MTQQTMYAAIVNSPQTELSAGIDGAVTTIPVVDASVLPAGPNLAVIGSDDTAETILYTATSGNNLTGCVRGFQGTAKAWSVGAKVARNFTAYDSDAFKGNIEDHETRINQKAPLASPALTGTPTAPTAAAGTNSTQLATTAFTVNEVQSLPVNAMSRQAIINGNFDVWQRGTSFTNSLGYTADRFGIAYSYTGTLPTSIIHSKQNLTPEDIAGSYNSYRITTNGAGSGFGANDIYTTYQHIENGVRYLCGNGKKVTLSFWAKSSIAGKKIGARIYQNYGTGGSPSAVEIVNGTAFTLTSSWVKYTVTFTTNTTVGKTFGTNNDDFLSVNLALMWGSSNAVQFGGGAAETFVGAGNIDIAQVQVCSGDVALPFQPRSFSDEEIKSLRFNRRIVATDVNGIFGIGQAISTTTAYIFIPFGVRMRIPPTLASLGNFGLYINSGTAIPAVTGISPTWANRDGIMLSVTVASGLTISTPVLLIANNDATACLNFDAEL